jgi:hypothetical protein
MTGEIHHITIRVQDSKRRDASTRKSSAPSSWDPCASGAYEDMGELLTKASRDRGDRGALGGLTWQAHAAGGFEDSRTKGTISKSDIQANPD